MPARSAVTSAPFWVMATIWPAARTSLNALVELEVVVDRVDHPTRVPGEVPFHLILKGSCTLELADRALKLAVGDVVLLPRGQSEGGRDLQPGEPRLSSARSAELIRGPGRTSRRARRVPR